MKKTITLIMMLLQIAAFAQNTVHYEYDATGNRIKRWISPPIPVAPIQNNTNSDYAGISDEMNALINADKISSAHINNLNLNTESGIIIFPNPFKEILNIQLNIEIFKGYSLQLYDGNGRLFYFENNLQRQTEVNMQSAKAGLYYLVIFDKKGRRLYWKMLKS